MYYQDSRLTKPTKIYRTPDNTVTNKQQSMGKDSQHYIPQIVRSRSFQVKNKPQTSTSLLTASTSSLVTSVPITSPKSTRPFNFHRHSSWIPPETSRTQLSSFSSWPKLTPPKTAPLNELHTQGQPKQWPVPTPTQQPVWRSRQQRLDRINQTGIRKISNSSDTTQAAGHSCNQSNSLTIDSQKSSFTSEMLDNSPAVIGRSHGGGSEAAEEELTDQEIQQQMNIEKCWQWMAQLPAKFSGMHILQERAPVVIE